MARGGKRLADPATRGRTPRVGIAARRLRPTVVEDIALARPANDNQPRHRPWLRPAIGAGLLLLLGAALALAVSLGG